MEDNLKLKPEEKYQKYLDLLMDSENDKNISKEDKDFLFSYLLSAVDDGFVPAQKRYAFGLIKGYIDGYAIDKDTEKGKTILLSIMDKDNEVMKYVGKSYLYGNNTFPLDIPQGIELLKKAESYHSLGYYFRDKDIKKSLEYYLLEHDKNDIDGSFEIADIYYFEDEVKDVELALKYYKEFYEYAKTEYTNYTVHDGYQYVVTKSFYVTIGNTYLIRMSIKNIDKAIYFYNEGIKLNDILSYEYLYLIYSDKNAGYYDIKRGINLLEKCYEMKNIWSTQELIKIYKNNKEVKNKEKALFYTFELVNMDFEMSEEDKNKEIAKTYYAFDDPKCIEYYEKAHDYLSLYLRYNSNSFGLNDIDKTIEYYKLSHENNIHYYTIASLYEKKEDFKTAFEYYNKGLENKEEDSIARLSLYYSWGIYVKRDYRMSYECDKMLVNSKNGSTLAKANIALRQIYGVDEEVEPSEAMENLKKLSDEGNNYAMAYYARELYEGDNIGKDLNKAYELFKKTETNSLSKYYLGLYYKYGIKVEKDYNKAFEYFNKTNFFSTYFELGKCYLYGFGTKKNVKLAKYNFKLAYYYGTKSALREYALACQYEVDDSSLVDDFKIIDYAYKNGLTDLKETRDELLEKIKAQEKKSNEYITHKTDVFISWYHKNIDTKNDIKKYLTDNSISVWESDEAPRKELDPAIIEAIKYAKSFLIILSYESINYSGYMPIEIDMIYDRVEKGFPLENISIFILPT